jgi:inner membrane protein
MTRTGTEGCWRRARLLGLQFPLIVTFLWWHWIVLGLVLAAFELVNPGGFFIIFFGCAAIAVGALSGAGLAGPLWMQVLLFSVLAVSSLLLFRRRLLQTLQSDAAPRAMDDVVGELGTVSEDLAPGGLGKVELRGSSWSARNDAATLLPRGARCRVVRVEGLLLHVEREGVG